MGISGIAACEDLDGSERMSGSEGGSSSSNSSSNEDDDDDDKNSEGEDMSDDDDDALDPAHHPLLVRALCRAYRKRYGNGGGNCRRRVYGDGNGTERGEEGEMNWTRRTKTSWLIESVPIELFMMTFLRLIALHKDQCSFT